MNNTNNITSLGNTVSGHSTQINNLINADIVLDARINALEEDTGWLNATITSPKLNAEFTYCLVRQKRGIVYVTGMLRYISAPADGEVLFVFPNSIEIPSQQIRFTCGDGYSGYSNELYIYNFNRYLCAGRDSNVPASAMSFSVSYPI